MSYKNSSLGKSMSNLKKRLGLTGENADSGDVYENVIQAGNTNVKTSSDKNGTTITVNGRSHFLAGVFNPNISVINNVVYLNGELFDFGNEEVKRAIARGQANIQFQIEGNVGSLDAGSTVVVTGNVEGDVKSGSNLTIGGDVKGNADSSSWMQVNGDVGKDASSGSYMKIGKNVRRNVYSGSKITVEGSIEGDVQAGGKVTVHNKTPEA